MKSTFAAVYASRPCSNPSASCSSQPRSSVGNGVVFAAVRQGGRPIGSTGQVELPYAAVAEWTDAVAVRVTNSTDLDEALAAADALRRSGGRRCRARTWRSSGGLWTLYARR